MTDNRDIKYPRLQVRLNPKLEKAIYKKAAIDGVSRARIVKDALYSYFRELDKAKDKPNRY